LSWIDFVRRYVWHEERTPYLVRPDRLSRSQARSELFAYAFLLTTLSSAVAAISVQVWARPMGPVVAVYAGSLAAAALALGMTWHPAAARYCLTAPLLLALAALTGLARPGMGQGERLVLGAVAGLWLAYALRVVRISRSLAGRQS
jgi:hypothetical protein